MKDFLCKAFVGSFPSDVMESDLFQLFSDAGLAIVSAKVIRDYDTGQSRRFGFVEFKSRADYDTALAMDGTSFRSRPINIKPAIKPTRRR